jgi:serine/threonine-protein kinase
VSEQQAQKADPLGRILVVDDNEDNRQVLSRRLRRQGYEVHVADSGPAALEACTIGAYDAILLDVMMPGMSGIEVLERLRKERGKTELPVIMATAKTDSVDVVDALKRGANDYVTKPIDFPVLLARLDTQIAMKREAEKRSGSVIDVTIGIEPGTVIDGRYEIVDKLGEGGFAVVYRATQLSTKQEVALKHARPDVLRGNEAVHLERFKREVMLIGQMNHPNVVRLIDSGTIPVRRGARPKPESTSTRIEGGAKQGDGLEERTSSRTRRRQEALEGDGQTTHVPYIVMEFLRGEPLSSLIGREGPLSPERAVDIILPIASALGAAHARGIVHRDVKPSNILLAEGPDGTIEPKMLDFGIAKLTEPDVHALTVSASLIGTPQYMPPEQARGLKDIDGRADQFSLAAVLYELLTGRSLYRGESLLELVAKVLDAEFMPVHWVRSDLPSGLPEVVAKALARERDDRYESMKAFGQALVPFASPGTALRWAESFGMDAEARLSLAAASRTGGHRVSSGQLPVLEPSRQVRIASHDDAPDPRDATVRFSLDELVESKNVVKARSIDVEEPEAKQAPAKAAAEDETREAASDEAPKKDDAGAKEPADEKKEVASDDAPKKDDARAQDWGEALAPAPKSEIPWVMIAVAIAVFAALLAKSFL